MPSSRTPIAALRGRVVEGPAHPVGELGGQHGRVDRRHQAAERLRQLVGRGVQHRQHVLDHEASRRPRRPASAAWYSSWFSSAIPSNQSSPPRRTARRRRALPRPGTGPGAAPHRPAPVDRRRTSRAVTNSSIPRWSSTATDSTTSSAYAPGSGPRRRGAVPRPRERHEPQSRARGRPRRTARTARPPTASRRGRAGRSPSGSPPTSTSIVRPSGPGMWRRSLTGLEHHDSVAAPTFLRHSGTPRPSCR